jgi:membrane associated rhomboid family serine protease
MFFLIIPYHVDVPMRCRPWMNWVIIGVTVLFYPLCGMGGRLTDLGESLMLGGSSPLGWIGHVLVHGSLVHLLGNMLFLWVFGNAVCAKVGNLAYPFIYFGLGFIAGLVFQVVVGGEAVGASGAINGIVGCFVVLYLLNEISCWYLYWFLSLGGVGSYSVSSFWMVLLWLAFDIWGAFRGGGNIAYAAHIGGFVAGFTLTVVSLKAGWLEMDRGERSLLDVLSGSEDP